MAPTAQVARYELWRGVDGNSGYKLVGRYRTFPEAAAAAQAFGGGLYRICAVGGGNLAALRIARRSRP